MMDIERLLKYRMEQSYSDGFADGYVACLKEYEKYEWHDLRKNPNDLPKEHHNYEPIENSSFSDYVLVITDKWHCPIVAYINLSVKLWHNPLTEQTFYDEHLGDVIAWKEIEELDV